MGPSISTYRTSSGATAVKVVFKRNGKRSFTHVGSAHDAAELEVLKARAERIAAGGQQALDLESLTGPAKAAAPAPGQGTGLVIAKRSQVLWDVLTGVWRDLGLDVAVGGDEAFAQMALARLVEPTPRGAGAPGSGRARCGAGQRADPVSQPAALR